MERRQPLDVAICDIKLLASLNALLGTIALDAAGFSLTTDCLHAHISLD